MIVISCGSAKVEEARGLNSWHWMKTKIIRKIQKERKGVDILIDLKDNKLFGSEPGDRL